MKLGYQLYSSRNFGPLDLTLEMISGLGYSQVEGYGDLFATEARLEALRAGLARYNLTMPSAHMAFDQVEGEAGRVIDLARDLGIGQIIVPYLEPQDRPLTSMGWATFGARLERAAEPYEQAGIRLGWHNHDFEFRELEDGHFPIQSMLGAAPSLVFEFDIAWAVRAGQDPFAWIARLENRITAAHVKDIAPEGAMKEEDGWADVGQGVMDWARLIARLRQIGCDLFVVEHDNPRNDQRFALRSLDYLQTV